MKNYTIPSPIIDEKEAEQLEILTERYKKLTTPSKTANLLKKANEKLPNSIKDTFKDLGDSIDGNVYYKLALDYAVKGFKTLESTAAKITINPDSYLKKVKRKLKDCSIESYEELCLLRSYDIAKLVDKAKTTDLLVAFTEGGATGAAGFAGIPFNIVASTFIYYRAVQSVAIMYGYDARNSPEELAIVGEVLTSALSPAQDNASEIGSVIAKIMVFAESTSLKQVAKKGWAEMIAHGGAGLLIAQMRALANGAAKKALQAAGKKGLEENAFKSVFKQIGSKLSLKFTQRAVPVFSAGIGALIDTATMKQILDFADIFYHKRFIIEKKDKIERLLNNEDSDDSVIVDADFEIIDSTEESEDKEDLEDSEDSIEDT